MVQALQERPPYVMFEVRSIEDRQATIEAGHYVGKDVDYAFITPAGSKDRIEVVVKEWFEQLENDVKSDRLPPEWLSHFKQKYKDFKAGETEKPNGYPVVNWPGLSPTQVKQLHSLRLFAVEDVASMNEETIHRLGMGGRGLKQRALDFLATAKDVGQVAEAASALKIENEQLKTTVSTMSAQLETLTKQVAAMAQAGQPMAQASAPAEDSISSDDLLKL